MSRRNYAKNKGDIVDCIRKDYKVTREMAKNMVDAVCCAIMETTVQGNSVNIGGFGTFRIYKSKPKKRFDINTKQVRQFEPVITVKFYAADSFANDVKRALEARENENIETAGE